MENILGPAFCDVQNRKDRQEEMRGTETDCRGFRVTFSPNAMPFPFMRKMTRERLILFLIAAHVADIVIPK